MKVFMLVLLSMLMVGERAHALVCFSCTKKKSLLGCLKLTFCSVDDKYCITQTTSINIDNKQKRLSKYCSAVCPKESHISGVTVVNTRCCNKSLCNVSSNDGGLQASSLVLGLSVLCTLLSTPGKPGA
ncbi:lymphocyte antigen 6E-like [Antechinus flavipes]|uniref:lymphocyte antigen 6E-like n=1 Tax=Antechinus flavipes TaxID=38775 RepID=UPI002236B24B|nr:lymphocyte antigen 6E-like [Antechinus flavipes]XP_051827145.1 lymphocyte antigen 6E-like [Antechinus flavipes]